MQFKIMVRVIESKSESVKLTLSKDSKSRNPEQPNRKSVLFQQFCMDIFLESKSKTKSEESVFCSSPEVSVSRVTDSTRGTNDQTN